MIAADTSTWIAYFHGGDEIDTRLLKSALSDHCVIMLPVVLAELFSDSGLPDAVAALLLELPPAPLADGFWQRAGVLRSKVLDRGFKARLADALIAQHCLDGRLMLITRDRDFRNFLPVANLDLLLEG
ncbi:MAG TPA: PIN domain-containing protein [Terriglobales bacterium]|nr:PIN domain-containing protein [Terriglobales bacterium]